MANEICVGKVCGHKTSSNIGNTFAIVKNVAHVRIKNARMHCGIVLCSRAWLIPLIKVVHHPRRPRHWNNGFTCTLFYYARLFYLDFPTD